MRKNITILGFLFLAGCGGGEPEARAPQSPARADSDRQSNADDQLWATSGDARCRTQVEPKACDGVRAYLRAYPEGKHTSDASASLNAHESKVRAQRDDREWAEADRDGCKAAGTETARDGVERYVANHPEGRHASEASTLLAEARPKVLKLRDERAWKGANDEACTAPTTEQGCAGVENYLATFPNGKHADEARAALKKGAPGIAALRKKREQEEAAAAKKREAEEAAAKRKRDAAAVWASDARGDLHRNEIDGQYYVKLTFVATMNKVKGYTYLHGSFRCAIGNKTFVNDSVGFLSPLKGMRSGDSKDAELAASFSGQPSRCDIQITAGDALKGTEEVAQYCWTPAKVSEGSCSP